MGKVHINSKKENRKKNQSGALLHLNPIPLIGPGLVEIQDSTPEALPLEVIKEIIKEVPVEVIKEVEKIVEIQVPSKPKIEYIEKPIEVIKEIEKIVEVRVPSEPVIQYIEKIAKPNDYELLKKQNKLLKILVPILAVVAIIGLII